MGVGLTDQQLRWAEALGIEKIHGDDAPHWIAERIGALALKGDEEGVERFKAIAACFAQILAARQTTSQ